MFKELFNCSRGAHVKTKQLLHLIESDLFAGNYIKSYSSGSKVEQSTCTLQRVACGVCLANDSCRFATAK